MNWLNKIQELTKKKDNSAELKKGEIKQILTQAANEILPDFQFLEYKNGCYFFQRLRQVNNFTVYETLHIIFSLKERNFSCSVASRLNPEYIFSNQYNIGLLNPHIDLKVLKHNRGALNIPDGYYLHNGQVETTTKIVKEIFGDYKKLGLLFLNNQFERLKSNPIINGGFEFINNLQTNKQNLRNDMTEELNKGGLLLSSIKHNVYLELINKLQSVSKHTKDDQSLIPLTAYELLQIYWAK